MADICGHVDYEIEVPVDIYFVGEKEPSGIVWWVRHPECEAAEILAARHAAEIQLEQIAKLSEGYEPPSGNADARREREKVAACVSRWDWGDWTFENGTVPECDFDGVMQVLEKQKWLFSDPYKAINKIANFTNPVRTSSVKTSGSKSVTEAKTTTD